MKTKHGGFRHPCEMPCKEWVRIFGEGSPAIALAKCCLARWKKCVEGVIPETDVAVHPATVIAAVEGTTVVAEVTATEGAPTEIVVMDEAPATTVEAMIALATAVMDQARAETLAVDPAAVHPNLHPA